MKKVYDIIETVKGLFSDSTRYTGFTFDDKNVAQEFINKYLFYKAKYLNVTEREVQSQIFSSIDEVIKAYPDLEIFRLEQEKEKLSEIKLPKTMYAKIIEGNEVEICSKLPIEAVEYILNATNKRFQYKTEEELKELRENTVAIIFDNPIKRDSIINVVEFDYDNYIELKANKQKVDEQIENINKQIKNFKEKANSNKSNQEENDYDDPENENI